MGILSPVSSVLVLASHPDDETLGCGGTLLRHRSLGDTLTWCIGTRPTAPTWSETVIKAKEREIEQVAAAYGFARVHRLGHPATRLAEVDRSIVISQLREVAAEAKTQLVAPGDLRGTWEEVLTTLLQGAHLNFVLLRPAAKQRGRLLVESRRSDSVVQPASATQSTPVVKEAAAANKTAEAFASAVLLRRSPTER